jgi:hypothetical protein
VVGRYEIDYNEYDDGRIELAGIDIIGIGIVAMIMMLLILLRYYLVGISLCCACAMSVCKDVSGSNSLCLLGSMC